MSNTKLWWASVGGEKTEPIRVVDEGGKKVFYTIGCNDPHDMDGVELLGEILAMPLSKRSRSAQNAANARWESQQFRHREQHGWDRGYRRWD